MNRVAPKCGPGRLQPLDTYHGALGMGGSPPQAFNELGDKPRLKRGIIRTACTSPTTMRARAPLTPGHDNAILFGQAPIQLRRRSAAPHLVRPAQITSVIPDRT